MNEKEEYFILLRPSARGMGSDTDISLVSKENLYVIKSEEEVNKALNNCTTYEGVPDLIKIPDHIPIRIKTLHFENKIFRVYNQWGFPRDIIVGDALFNRYFVDFTKCEGDLRKVFKEKCEYEFMDFSFKKVAENRFFLFYKAEDLVVAEKVRIKRLSGSNDDMWIKQLNDAKATIKKFENLPELKDEYYDHFYDQTYVKRNMGSFKDIVKEDIANDDVDHTLCAYSYPLIPDSFAVEYKKNDDPSKHLRYDELFKKGTDVTHLVADLIGSSIYLEGFKYPQIDLALLSVFGYD